jgi:hypothetical protein
LRAGSLGLLMDRENGMLVWAPIHLLLPAAWMLAGAQGLAWLLPAAALYLVSAAHDRLWGGFSPAGRFLAPLVPVFALLAARALRERSLRAPALALAVPQLLVLAAAWSDPRGPWPLGDGHNRVVGGLPQRFGIPETLLPALRPPAPEVSRAALALAFVLVLNAAVWIAIRSRRPLSARSRPGTPAPG